MAAEKMPDDPAELKKMITDLRKEAASRRVKAKPFEQAFDGFNEKEVAYLLELVEGVAQDPVAGAAGFRDLAKDLMKDEFYEGLDDVPAVTKEEETEETKDMPALTREELVALLDERDGKAAQTAAEKEAESQAEAVFREVEEAGFARGTKEFMSALQIGRMEAELGNEVDFKELAPRIYAAAGVEPPANEELQDGEGESEPETKHPKTVDVEGSGSATETVSGVVEEAKEKGKSPLEIARDRLEARFG